MNEAMVKIKGQNPYIIKKEDIKKHSDFHTVINNIYCPTMHCDTKLTYVNSNSPHLRTFRMHNHIPECIYSKERIEEERRKRVEGIVSGNIPEKSLRLKQNYGFKKYFSQPNLSNNVLKQKDSSSKPNKSSKKESDKAATQVNVVSFDNPNVIEHETKIAPIPSIHIDEIDEKYLNKPINLYGELKCMDITENLTILTLKSSKKNKILLPEAYFSSTDLHNPKLFLEIIYRYFKDTNKGIPVCVTSILTNRDDTYIINVPSFSNLTFLEPGNSSTLAKDAGQLASIISRKNLNLEN